MTEFASIYCPATIRVGHTHSRCGRLIARVSSTMTGEMELKCLRCRNISVLWSSEATLERRPIGHAVH